MHAVRAVCASVCAHARAWDLKGLFSLNLACQTDQDKTLQDKTRQDKTRQDNKKLTSST